MRATRSSDAETSPPLRVLVAECSSIVRSGLRDTVFAGGWATPVFADSCAQARSAVTEATHAVLLAADIPCPRGVDHHRSCVRELSAGARTVLLVVPHTRHLGAVALTEGAFAVAELCESPERIRGLLRDGTRPSPARPHTPTLGLREAHLLRLYAEGHTLTECAAAMHISTETARTHLVRIRRKYAAANRPATHRSALLLRAIEDAYLPWPIQPR